MEEPLKSPPLLGSVPRRRRRRRRRSRRAMHQIFLACSPCYVARRGFHVADGPDGFLIFIYKYKYTFIYIRRPYIFILLLLLLLLLR